MFSQDTGELKVRCLVTGATGHIGSHLLRCLLRNKVEVAVLIRQSSNLWRIEDIISHLEVIRGDLSNLRQSGIAIRKFSPEVIFHLGWYGTGSRHYDEPAQLEQNLYGSLELLSLAYESGCKRWVGLGSQAEYGVYNGILTEDVPTRPITFYGTVKLCVSLLSQRLCEALKIDFVWLRLLATYGPMDSSGRLIPSVIRSLLRGERPALTSGEQRWDYLYVEDAVDAIWRAAITPEVHGIFNLGSGQAYTVRSIVERLRDLVDPSLSLGFGEVPFCTKQIMHLQADISRLQRVIGWTPRVSLDEGLKMTIDWYRACQRQ